MKKQKNNLDPLPSLRVIEVLAAIFLGVYPILCNSFKLLSDIRLDRLGNGVEIAAKTGHSGINAGGFWVLILLVGGYCIVQKMIKNPVISMWMILITITLFLILMGGFIWKDFPHRSDRTDLLSEIMMICMFAIFFPVIVDFVRTAISKKAYDQRFWVITGSYSAIYLFLWPALIGDVITILSV